MSFFDSINPFKKKEEFNFDTGSSGSNMDYAQPNIDTGHNFDSGNFAANPPQPLDDHRMTMPLGESVRQQRVQAMYGGEEQHYSDSRYAEPAQQLHNPMQKELELISSKLDYLKASLDAINQRLVNLEHLSKQEMENNYNTGNYNSGTKRW